MKPLRSARLLAHHHEGRRAEAALGVVGPVLDRHEKSRLEGAIERYRAGHREPHEALLMLAQLVALADLRADLESDVKRGSRAMERMIDEASDQRG